MGSVGQRAERRGRILRRQTTDGDHHLSRQELHSNVKDWE